VVTNCAHFLEECLAFDCSIEPPRKVNLTEANEACHDRCARILAELEEADHVRGGAIKAMAYGQEVTPTLIARA
jgi:hypothetical protein